MDKPIRHHPLGRVTRSGSPKRTDSSAKLTTTTTKENRASAVEGKLLNVREPLPFPGKRKAATPAHPAKASRQRGFERALVHQLDTGQDQDTRLTRLALERQFERAGLNVKAVAPLVTLVADFADRSLHDSHDAIPLLLDFARQAASGGIARDVVEILLAGIPTARIKSSLAEGPMLSSLLAITRDMQPLLAAVTKHQAGARHFCNIFAHARTSWLAEQRKRYQAEVDRHKANGKNPSDPPSSTSSGPEIEPFAPPSFNASSDTALPFLKQEFRDFIEEAVNSSAVIEAQHLADFLDACTHGQDAQLLASASPPMRAASVLYRLAAEFADEASGAPSD